LLGFPSWCDTRGIPGLSRRCHTPRLDRCLGELVRPLGWWVPGLVVVVRGVVRMSVLVLALAVVVGELVVVVEVMYRVVVMEMMHRRV
jgi:hypothetical protein